MRKFLLSVLCLAQLFCISQNSSSSKHTISGFVGDLRSREKLVGAVVLDIRTRKATTTNAFGFYSLTLPSDSVSLVISYVGFEAKRVRMQLDADKELNVDLLPSNEIATVDVVASETEGIAERSGMSSINLPAHQIKKVPALLGEVDVLKVLQLMPGVKSGGEGTSGLYVRGGGPDQNLILLDGAPIYNASHLFGFFSTFNADAIKNLELIKGGFPARYGGRLSSVIDITMKEGNMRRYNVEGAIGLISSRVLVEGPIWRDRTSFIVTARRTYLDVLTKPLVRLASGGEGGGGYYFYDLNAKVNHIVSQKDRIFLSLYTGLDKFSFKTGGAYTGDISYGGYLRWGNTLAALRWNHLFSSRLFCNTSIHYTSYHFGLGQEMIDYANDTKQNSRYYTGINDWSARVNFDYIPHPSHSIKFGGHFINHTFKTGAEQFKSSGFARDVDSSSGNPDVFGAEGNLYVEDDWRISDRIKINIGLHAAGFDVQNRFYTSLQPRFSGRCLLPFQWSVKASYADMTQFIHLLSNSNVGLPTDLWVPATARVSPQRSRQVAVGLARGLRGQTYEVSLEGYYKTMDNIIDYLDGANFIGGKNNWEDKVAQGKGWSYGAEFLIQKKKGKYTGWIGYTLSWTNRQFTEINEGRVYPYKYDRRHDISIVNMYKVSNKLDVACTWVYGTGNAITLPLQSYLAAPLGDMWTSDVNYYGGKNNYRMAPYHRLDLSVNRHKKKKWGRVTWSFGVYNLYGRQNPYFLYFATNQYGRKQLKQVSLFVLIPSISYNFKFDFRYAKDIFKDDEELKEFESLYE